MTSPTGTTPLVVHEVFDFAMRVGEVKLANGAGAADVTATMLAIARSAGIAHVDADVTFSVLTMSHLPSKTSSPITRMRMVTDRGMNFYRLAEADTIAAQFVRNELRITEAQRRISQVLVSPQRWFDYKVLLGGAMVGGGAAWIFGGGPPVVLAAVVASVLIHLLNLALLLLQWPKFFNQVICGFVGALVGVAVHFIDPAIDSSLVVAVSIIALLAGLTSMAAMQDAISGWYVTAAGRGFEALMLTVGVSGGVTGGIALANGLGITMAASPYQIPPFSNFIQLAACGAITALGFSMWCASPRRSWFFSAVLGAICILTYTALGAVGMQPTWANGMAAAIVGVLAAASSRVLGLSPLLLITPAVVPLLPGYMLFRGLTLMSQSDYQGIVILIAAGSIAVSLASGAVFGQFLGMPLARTLPTGAARLNLPVLAQPFSSLRMRRLQRAQQPRRRRRKTREDL